MHIKIKFVENQIDESGLSQSLKGRRTNQNSFPGDFYFPLICYFALPQVALLLFLLYGKNIMCAPGKEIQSEFYLQMRVLKQDVLEGTENGFVINDQYGT